MGRRRYGAVLLALAATIELAQLFRHDRSSGDVTQSSSTPIASPQILTLPDAPASSEHAKEASQDSPPLKSTMPGNSAMPADGREKNSAGTQLPLPTATTGSVGGGQPIAAQGDKEAPTVPPRQRETVIHATAILGSPVGVGKIEMLFRDDQCPAWNTELPLCVDDLQHRVRFPAIDVMAREPNGDSPHRIRHAVVYFLFLGASH